MSSFNFCYISSIFSFSFSPLDKYTGKEDLRTPLVCFYHSNRIKIPGRDHAKMCKFGKMKSPLNSWNPQALGPARRAALDFWAGAQIQKLLLCFQNRVHIHILVTSFYKEYWNTAKYLQQDTWRAQLRLKWERNKMCLKNLPRSERKRKRQTENTFECRVGERWLPLEPTG